MDLPDDSQWDETTCNLAICQHPQCWATIRRIERGHPRILGSPCKIPLDDEDKLPELTVVNMSDSCSFPRHLSEFTFTKAHSLLSRGSKFNSKFQGRPQKGLPDRSLINSTNRSPKLSVLNLNETQLPCSKDVRNMVVIWIPEESEKYVSQHGKKKIKKLATKNSSSLSLSGKQYPETQSRIPVPPPTPVPLSEQLSPDFIPFWSPPDTLPQDLLVELLSDGEKTMPCPEMKIQLTMMKKNLPLEKKQPNSAISSKMFLSIHRLTLEEPALRYPEHLKKLHYNLKTEGHSKQQQRQQRQQQRKVKTPTKKQEAKKKAKSGPGRQRTSHKQSVAIACDPLSGHRTLPGQKSDMKQEQQMELEGATLKQDSTETPKMDYSEKYMNFRLSMESPGLSETEPTKKDISAPEEPVQEAQASMSGESWNPELKLLRILQASDDEDEENQSFGAEC
uniref:Chromosome 9 open reading frame 43 n=1 Tax=Propithecus coquereli TaxID=379532 RepID=A0A2K6GS22_PROCO